mgnify:CR=1 FL=1
MTENPSFAYTEKEIIGGGRTPETAENTALERRRKLCRNSKKV